MRRGRTAAALALVGGALLGWLIVPALTSTGPREDLPSSYARRRNPRAEDPRAVAVGAVLFAENCTSCHGAHADGRGAAAVGLTPPPADLQHDPLVGQHSDAYLFYRLSEGKPGTAMPSFRGSLAEDERWAVVAYLRALRAGTVPVAR